ncbi:hypothetical protein VFDL14_21530 [Vibrio fortis]|uniref:Transposase DDE domain-containing protein n=1 Tax=Vibrio fortis TaxID=212667 RepID=A0A066UJ51_9VIBR|nr:hypothetical protein VFDL14_21530 [Vibrio fortis]
MNLSYFCLNSFAALFWVDEDAVTEWKHSKQGVRGRTRIFSVLIITTALMVKRVFTMPLRALQGFIDSVFRQADVPFRYTQYLHQPSILPSSNCYCGAKFIWCDQCRSTTKSSELNSTYHQSDTRCDDVYDTRKCCESIGREKTFPLIPPREGAAFFEIKDIPAIRTPAVKSCTFQTRNASRNIAITNAH